ncbi:MAG: hypothetical protein KIS66_18030, partial [Fimbriimonadaceae bacterium]|nr:hypothetical protein [Fimbriimonadaceae bacterium]
LLAKTGSSPDPRFLWSGDTGSRTTGLAYSEQYNRARHYGSMQAGWTSARSVAPSAYEYAMGDPIARSVEPAVWTDPGVASIVNIARAMLVGSRGSARSPLAADICPTTGNHGRWNTDTPPRLADEGPPGSWEINRGQKDFQCKPTDRRGETVCGVYGKVYYWLCDRSCGCGCLAMHEREHVREISDCCGKFQVKEGASVSDKLAAVERFRLWRTNNITALECRGYAVEVSCYVAMLLTYDAIIRNGFPSKEILDCRRKLPEYIADTIALWKKLNCPSQPAVLTPCS